MILIEANLSNIYLYCVLPTQSALTLNSARKITDKSYIMYSPTYHILQGFPFDDDPFRRKSSRLKGDLHGYLAERYPDIADQLKDWTDDSRFDRHLDNHRPPSGRSEEHQKPSGRPRGHQEPGAERRNDYFGQGNFGISILN